MSDTTTLIAALENAPGIIIPLIREVPPQYLKRRPSPAKWSAYEHACHLSTSDGPFLARLDLMLSAPEPYIKSIVNSPEEESVEDWKRTAEHEAFSHYSVWIMFRHVLNHEMFHAYRIEELLLKKDWE